MLCDVTEEMLTVTIVRKGLDAFSGCARITRSATFGANQANNFDQCLHSSWRPIHLSAAGSLPNLIFLLPVVPHHYEPMHLFLIRHGETEHNVAGLLAGITDSRLTNHGLIQAQRLGTYLVQKRELRFSHVFSSDLQRAYKTANEICEAQNNLDEATKIVPAPLELLREQDFGSFELIPWNRSQDLRQDVPKSTDPDFKPRETAEAMKHRADTFLDDYFFPLLVVDNEVEQHVAVVSHGLFLAALWKAMLLRFNPSAITIQPEALVPDIKKPLEHLPSWNNTGYLQLRILTAPDEEHRRTFGLSAPSPNVESTLSTTMTICTVNGKEHLTNLKRTRGGLGSSAADDKQKRLDTFFKKPKSPGT